MLPAQTSEQILGFNRTQTGPASAPGLGLGPVGSRANETDVKSFLFGGKGRLERDEHLARAAVVAKSDVPCAAQLAGKWRGKTLIIVGGGPSLDDAAVEELRRRIEADRANVCVMTLNKTHDFLVQGVADPRRRHRWFRRPIIPEFAMMLDPKPWCADYITPHSKPLYLLGTGVDPCVWAKFKLHPFARTFWFFATQDREAEIVPGSSDVDEFIQGNKLTTAAVLAGGSNVGLRAINAGMMLGFDTFELWGFDSCYAPMGMKLYAYDKPNIEHNAVEFTLESRADGSRFRVMANEAMQRQVVQFAGVVKEIENIMTTKEANERGNPVIERLNIWKAWINGKPQHSGVIGVRPKIRVAGDGAIPWMAWKDGGPDKVVEHINPARMAAKYGASRHWDYTRDAEYIAGPVKADPVEGQAEEMAA